MYPKVPVNVFHTKEIFHIIDLVIPKEFCGIMQCISDIVTNHSEHTKRVITYILNFLQYYRHFMLHKVSFSLEDLSSQVAKIDTIYDAGMHANSFTMENTVQILYNASHFILSLIHI